MIDALSQHVIQGSMDSTQAERLDGKRRALRFSSRDENLEPAQRHRGQLDVQLTCQAFSQQLDGCHRAWCGNDPGAGDVPGCHPGVDAWVVNETNPFQTKYIRPIKS